MKKNLVVAIFAIVTSLFLTACDKGEAQKETNSSGVVKNAGIAVEVIPLSIKEKGDKFAITHSLGTSEVVKNPQKVVILDLGVLDNFESLGLSDKVAGVPVKNLPDYLASFKDKPSVGGVVQVDFEAINALKPDLIVMSGRQIQAYDKLSQIAPTIFTGVGLEDFLGTFKANTETIAKLYGKEEEAKAKIAEIEALINETKAKVDPSKKALVVLTNANKISAYGTNSRFGIIHDVLGIGAIDESIKVGTHGKSINSEYILEKNPDFIFVVDRNVIVGNKERAQGILDNALVAKTKAAQEGKIIYLDPQNWYLVNGNGLASLKEMVKEIAKNIE